MTSAAPAAPPVASLSPSRASDFKACPLRYRFRVIDKLAEAPTPAAARGTLVHAVLEQLFDLPAARRVASVAIGLLPAAWDQLQASEPQVAELFAGAPPGTQQQWLASAAELLESYFTLEDPRRLSPAGREQYVEHATPDGLLLRGIIDRLDAAPDGALRVVDYKTGKAPGVPFEGKALFQLKFYALILWRSRGVLPAVLQLLYLADRQRLSYTPDEGELVAFERQLQALGRAIATATATGEFAPRVSALCAYCDHQSRCPAFGGTAPPYPGAAQPAVSSA